MKPYGLPRCSEFNHPDSADLWEYALKALQEGQEVGAVILKIALGHLKINV